MGDESDVSSTGTVSTLTATSYSIFNLTSSLKHTRYVAEFPFSDLPSAAQNRIKKLLLTGFLDSGKGYDFVREVLLKNYELSYIFINSRYIQGPYDKYGLRTNNLIFHGCADDVIKVAEDHHKTDIARWKMISKKELPPMLRRGVHPYGNDHKILYLSGAQSKQDLRKVFGKVLMTTERKILGDLLWRSISSSTIRLENK